MVGYTSNENGTKSKSYTFTFKALKSGSTRVSISSYDVYANDFSSMSMSTGSKTIRVMTQQELEATYSKDNSLKALSVEGYELDKEFAKDTLEYTVNVPTGTTKVVVKATKNDSTASVSGDGEITVTEGLNTIPIVVTAQNGSEKTYTLTVNVEDQNPIEVSVDNKVLTVVKNASLLVAPVTFNETTIIINEFEIPAFVNNTANITLVGLKDTNGEITLYQYDNGDYVKYNQLSLENLLLIPTTFTEELDYPKVTVNIGGEDIEAYKYMNDTEFAIISAIDLNTGEANLYLYDTLNNQAIRFDKNYTDYNEEVIHNYTNIIIILSGVIGLMLILIISLIHRLRKNEKRIDQFVQKQEAKIEATRKLNDVVEEVKNILEEQAKSEEEKAEVQEEVKLSKKEQKKLKKEQALKANEQAKEEPVSKQEETSKSKEKKEETKEEIKPENKTNEVKKEKKEEKPIVSEATEEMYDLFGEDKKKQKKKQSSHEKQDKISYFFEKNFYHFFKIGF